MSVKKIKSCNSPQDRHVFHAPDTELSNQCVVAYHRSMIDYRAVSARILKYRQCSVRDGKR
jgi:hypothetical protein